MGIELNNNGPLSLVGAKLFGVDASGIVGWIPTSGDIAGDISGDIADISGDIADISGDIADISGDIAVIKWLVSGLNKMVDNPVVAPLLHWDADIDPYVEQMYGPHTFNHAVLSPQYQRNADGSYTDVGAKPAVDVFDGEKWLRSCGAVTNLLPSGAEDLTVSSWENNGKGTLVSSGYPSPSGDLGAYWLYDNPDSDNTPWFLRTFSGQMGGTYTFSIMARAKQGTDTVRLRLWDDAMPSGEGSSPENQLTEEWQRISFTNTMSNDNVTRMRVGLSSLTSIIVCNPQLTATSYPVPYVPPGVTQPASNATTTNGMWFSLPDGSPLWQALTGEPLTLATRVRMGVGSGDLANSTWLHFASASATNTRIVHHSYVFSNGTPGIVRASDGSGTPPPEIYSPWPRNAIITRVTQVNTSGTQYRVGYMIEGTHTTIQWSEWKAYDGSFDPSTLYRLMLGYGNAYPMWYNKITVWKEQVSDDSILAAMS